MASTPKPNLFLIGAMRSGTTSLYNYLRTHPQIFMSPHKEPTYFADPDELRAIWPHKAHEMTDKGQDYYLELFRDAGAAPVVGEASTCYTMTPTVRGVAERIAEFNADARFIYVMRDPIDRTVSHYWHRVRFEDERRDMMDALEAYPPYREVSHYAMQLKPYIERFGAERVRTLTTEAMIADPRKTLRDLFEWLEIDQGYVPPNLGEQFNATPETFSQSPNLSLASRLHKSKLWCRLSPRLPRGLKSALRPLYYRRPVDRTGPSVEEAVEHLRPILLRQTDELSRLLGREFPEWQQLRQGI